MRGCLKSRSSLCSPLEIKKGRKTSTYENIDIHINDIVPDHVESVANVARVSVENDNRRFLVDLQIGRVS